MQVFPLKRFRIMDSRVVGKSERKSKMIFSCLVPVYNIDRVILDKCIDSILTQTFLDFEVVIVDDGSSPETGLICDNYANKDKRIRVIHQDNQGLSGARNTAVAAARGEWLVHIDGDDWVEPNMLKRFYDAIENNNNLDIIFSGYQVTNNNRTIRYLLRNKHILEKPYIELKSVILCSILSNGPEFKDIALNTTWGKAFRKTFIYSNDLSFNTELRRVQDIPYSLEAFYKAQNICYLDDALFNYRLDNESLSRSYNDKTYDRMKKTASVCLRFANDHKDIEGLYESACTFVLRCFKIIIKNDFMSKQNPQNKKLRKERFLKALASEPFTTAFLNCNYNSWNPLDRLEAHMIVSGKFNQLDLYNKIRSLLRKFK